eukprot:SAG22_NODE_1256_length_4995_cov_4.293096_4_plen_202_part_00
MPWLMQLQSRETHGPPAGGPRASALLVQEKVARTWQPVQPVLGSSTVRSAQKTAVGGRGALRVRRALAARTRPSLRAGEALQLPRGTAVQLYISEARGNRSFSDPEMGFTPWSKSIASKSIARYLSTYRGIGGSRFSRDSRLTELHAIACSGGTLVCLPNACQTCDSRNLLLAPACLGYAIGLSDPSPRPETPSLATNQAQ